jgi:Fic family protein
MNYKEKIEQLTDKYDSKQSLSDKLKISRQTLYNILAGSEPEKTEIQTRIDFEYFRLFKMTDPSDNEIEKYEKELFEYQYLINPSEEHVFKDFTKRFSFGSYELEMEDNISQETFSNLADGAEIEKNISRQNALEMINLYTLTSKILKDVSSGKKIIFTEELIQQWHYSLMQGIRTDAGEYSTKIRIIENSSISTVDPREIQNYMLKWLNTANKIKNIRDIASSHALFERIHPFGDGNGRLGRIIVAVQSIMAGFIPPLISKENMAAYYASLESVQAGKSNNTLAFFFIEAMQATAKTLPLLPKGVEDAKNKSNGGDLKFGYNQDFIDQAVLQNEDIINAFVDEGSRVSLSKVKQNPEAISELTLSFAYGTSRIEGSTLNKLDTIKFLKYGTFPDYKYDDEDLEQKETDKQMALNNKKVMDFALEDTSPLSKEKIIKIHDLTICDIKHQGNNGISQSERMVYTASGSYVPVKGSEKLERLLDDIIQKAYEIKDPFVKSFFLHFNIAYLQPFDDGNKRTARAVGNIPLIENNLIPFSYDTVNRDRYINSLTKFYEYGVFEDGFVGQVLKSYEKSIEKIEDIFN